MLGMSHWWPFTVHVPVRDQLAGAGPVRGEPEPVDDVVQPPLEHVSSSSPVFSGDLAARAK